MENTMETAKKGGFRKALRFLVSALLSLLLMASVYVGAVLLQTPLDERGNSFVVQEEREPVTRMQSASSGDPRELARLFGAPLPMLEGHSAAGTGENTLHDGETVRLATLRYNGLTVTAVQPPSAAPLLLHPELSVSLHTDLTTLNLPAMLAEKGEARCAYFATEEAAYSVYTPEMSQENFFAVLSRLIWAQ